MLGWGWGWLRAVDQSKSTSSHQISESKSGDHISFVKFATQTVQSQGCSITLFSLKMQKKTFKHSNRFPPDIRVQKIGSMSSTSCALTIDQSENRLTCSCLWLDNVICHTNNSDSRFWRFSLHVKKDSNLQMFSEASFVLFLWLCTSTGIFHLIPDALHSIEADWSLVWSIPRELFSWLSQLGGLVGQIEIEADWSLV